MCFKTSNLFLTVKIFFSYLKTEVARKQALFQCVQREVMPGGKSNLLGAVPADRGKDHVYLIRGIFNEGMGIMCKKSSVLVIALLFVFCIGAGIAQALTPEEELGKSIFFDDNLSINGNQSCAACHAPESGWTGPDPAINAAGAVYEGSIAGPLRQPQAAVIGLCDTEPDPSLRH